MTGFWTSVAIKRIFPSRQDGVSVSIDKVAGDSQDVVAVVRVETRNIENFALLTVDELATMCRALAEILADHTPSLQNVDPRPHLEDLDEIDATLESP